MKWNHIRRMLARLLVLGGISVAVGLTGCQSEIGGQMMGAHYPQDDAQFFAPGPEFKLSREAAAMKQFSDEQQFDAGP